MFGSPLWVDDHITYTIFGPYLDHGTYGYGSKQFQAYTCHIFWGKNINALYLCQSSPALTQKKASRWWIPGVPDSEKHKVETLSE